MVKAVFCDNATRVEASNIKDIFWNKTNKKSAQLTK